MTDYLYKGFKVFYTIKPTDKNKNLYIADGHVLCCMHPTHSEPRKFHTEYPSKAGVETEIKKMLEDYIDFEWHEYHEMQEEIK